MYFSNVFWWDIIDRNIRLPLKLTAVVLYNPSQSFSIVQINIHSLCPSGANAPSLSRYTDWQFQKMDSYGRMGQFSKKHMGRKIFSNGMPTNMKIYCKVVNIPNGVYHIMMAVILSTKFKIDAAGG